MKRSLLVDFNFAKVSKLWQSSYKKWCEPQGQVVNERRKDEGKVKVKGF
ncbi:phosphatidylserine decarboxylase [Capnocytophaga ochracea]|nr:phosphatidylserine decarboxylase [Capnocytophaga ochracea]